MLNDLLTDRLKALDDTLLQAIREVFNEQVTKELNFIQPGDSNVLIGEKYRACRKGEEIINNAFIEMQSYQGGRAKTKLFRKEL